MRKTVARASAPEGSWRAALQALPDVRRGQGKVHPLDGMLALAVCALLCGCRSLYAISQWGRECAPAIRVALGLRAQQGPSVATLHRAFKHLDHPAFERVLGAWFAAQGLAPDEALAVDGKTLRGIHGEEIPGVHLVAAFAHQTRGVLAQAETAGRDRGQGPRAGRGGRGARRAAAAPAGRPGGDRRRAVGHPRLVPADPGKRGHYFVVLKATQPLTREAVALSFADRWTPRQRVVVGDRHGDREERRTVECSTEVVPYLAQAERLDAEEGEAGTIAGWAGLAQVCRLHREVEFVSGAQAGTTRDEWAYALTSLPPEQADAARLERLWRGHWQIENGLHYVRDVTLGEDACQVRAGRAPANLAACRNTALNLLRRAGVTNVAAALRRHAMDPRRALALMGIALA